jgi:uncharacterized protein (DUF927 family)
VGFQLFGPAETGKTAAAMVTGSIWGCHRSAERRENGFSESWHKDLHEFENGQKFTDALKVRCRKFYGTAGEEFVRRLVQDRARDASALKQVLKEERKAYLQAIKAQAQAQNFKPLNRASGRFATTFAAGSLAIKYGILPWTRDDLLQAILSCQLDGLRYSQTENQQADSSVTGLRRKVVSYLADNRGQFRNLDKKMPPLGKHNFGSRPGYFATFKGKKWFYLTTGQLKSVIGSGKNADQLKAHLVAEGLLGGTSTGKYRVQRRIFSDAKGNKGHEWVHAFSAKILQDRAQD